MKSIFTEEIAHALGVRDRISGCDACNVEGCERPNYCRGLCSRHYQSDLKNGSRLALPRQYPRAKLTEEQVLTIRRMRGHGVPYKELSKRFNVSKQAIYYAVTRHTWGNLRMRRVARNAGCQGEGEGEDLAL